GLVLLLSAYWGRNLTLGIGLLLTLIAVPSYVSKLLSRLEVAKAEAEAANVAKTRFLAAASHDLRQPVQALSMYASVLEGRTRDTDAQRVAHGVQLSVKTLERLFDSLLDISKIESGVVKPCLASFPVMPLIDEVVEEERPLAAQKGLELRAVRTSAWVESDPALLERMVKNLVTNAIRYTEHGRIVVGCRRAGGRVRLEVLDTGIGIAVEEHGRIFDDYYQIDGASGQGLGLGLPIVKSLGALLGHAVAVRSAPGRGSVFSIELPVAAGRDAPVPAPAAQAAPAAGSVVLVDDDVEIRRSMHLLLEGWGYDLVSGSSVEDVEAELGLKGIKPDALIVDYRLASAMTGAHVVERLRAAFGARLPALVITGNADVASVRAQLPGLPIAVKPVPPGKLRAFLSQALASA
ncbi:MAG TPA: hybrid sensor histidine kinase/response regulator, partial [Burkholderiales bacterium]|nr:hybrid sensor histidine kinase/response regulator [Burkholderiales bacterium]